MYPLLVHVYLLSNYILLRKLGKCKDHVNCLTLAHNRSILPVCAVVHGDATIGTILQSRLIASAANFIKKDYACSLAKSSKCESNRSCGKVQVIKAIRQKKLTN